MKFLLRIADLILHTNLFTACCAVGLVMATEQLILQATPALVSPLHMVVLGGALLVYNAPRIFRKPALRPARFRPYYFVFFVAGGVLVACSSRGLPLSFLSMCAVLALLAFAYSLPLLPFGGGRRLRDHGLVKTAVLAGVWTMVTAILPMCYWHIPVSAYPFEIAVRLVFIFMLCVVYDIRDIQTDHSNNLSTLPQRVGLQNSYRLIYAALLLFIVLGIVRYMRYQHMGLLAGTIITAAATLGMVTYLRRYPSVRAYLLLADGVMIVYAVLAVTL